MLGGPAMAPAAGPGAVAGAAGSAAAAQEEMRWRQLDSGVSAVSFGFVATAILVSMFLAMAILEHFLRAPGWAAWGRRPRRPEEEGSSPPPPPPPPPRWRRGRGRRPGRGSRGSQEARRPRVPEMPVYAKGVSVLMPGHDVPTFIAHPAPAPCPPERIRWPSHQPTLFSGSSSNPS